MIGRIGTKERCHCGGEFTLQFVREMPGLYCANGCRTVPRKFYMDGRGFHRGKDVPPDKDERVKKLYSGLDGEPLDSYLRTARLMEHVRAVYDKDKDNFDPTPFNRRAMKAHSVRECARAWQLHLESSKKKSAGYTIHAEMFFRLHILPFPVGKKTFGDLNVRTVTPSNIEALQKHLQAKIGKRGKPLGEITVKNILSVLMTMFHRLNKRGLDIGGYNIVLDKIPAFPEDWSKLEPKKKNWINEATQADLLDRMTGWLKLWTWIFYETGMRMGEVCALHRCDVLPDRTIYVQRAIDGVTGKEKPTKTLDQRTVHISEELYQAIVALPVVGDAYIFVGKKGKPYTSGAISSMLREVYDAAGLPNLKPNASGRHSMATKRKNEAAEKGFEAAAEQLGNAPGMSKRAYVQDGSTRVHVPSVSPLKIESI